MAQAKDKDLSEKEKSLSEENVLMNKNVGFSHNCSIEWAKNEYVLGYTKPRS